jgi:hypothetical protein
MYNAVVNNSVRMESQQVKVFRTLTERCVLRVYGGNICFSETIGFYFQEKCYLYE